MIERIRVTLLEPSCVVRGDVRGINQPRSFSYTRDAVPRRNTPKASTQVSARRNSFESRVIRYAEYRPDHEGGILREQSENCNDSVRLLRRGYLISAAHFTPVLAPVNRIFRPPLVTIQPDEMTP